MHTQTDKKKLYFPKLGAYLFNFGLLAGLATLTFGLVSCGGGGASGTTGNPGNTTPSLDPGTPMVPAGIVASSVNQTLAIYGANFVNGMALSLAESSGVPVSIISSSVTSSTAMTIQVNIPTVPADNYVTFTIKSSGGSTYASAVLGVAGAVQTAAAIQTIFSNTCTGCHNSTTLSAGMDLSNMAIGNSTGVIGITSSGCAPKFRITPGDPRRASSVLIDKIEATSAVPACNGAPMPKSAAPLSSSEIQAIIDWVAGGAK